MAPCLSEQLPAKRFLYPRLYFADYLLNFYISRMYKVSGFLDIERYASDLGVFKPTLAIG